MAKTKISEFDSNPANNTDIDGINLAEGMAPGLVNNAIRELMAQLKDQQAGTAGDNFTVGGNLSVTGNTTYSGTLTGSTGVINIGSGQFYKDTSGNFGLGTTSPTNRLTVSGNANVTGTFAVGSNATVTGSLTAASLAGGASTGSGASGTWGINVSGNSATTSQTNFSNLTIGGNQVLSAANYNNYAPTRTGGGASGTWGINITGNAASVTNGVYNNGGTYGINIAGSAAYAGSSGSTGSVNGANGGTISGQLNVNGMITAAANTGRPFYMENGTGSTYIRGDAGGWTLRYAFMTANGSPFGGFGAAGNNNSPSYFWVANDALTSGVYLPYGGTSWVALSDINSKQLNGEISNGLSKVNSLRSVYYNYNTDAEGAKRRVGLIAQEVQAVLPEAVSEIDLPGRGKVLSLAYTEVVPLLVAAIKELSAKVEALEAKVGA